MRLGNVMREKSPRIVVTFATTSDAMAMEAAAREHGIPGRIIPVPSEIDAGCGLSWCADLTDKQELESSLDELALAFEGMHVVLMY